MEGSYVETALFSVVEGEAMEVERAEPMFMANVLD
jgi:hypothetical protein